MYSSRSGAQVAQVRGAGTVQHAVDAELRQRRGQVLEQPPAAAEKHGHEGDVEFVPHAEVQIPLDHLGAGGDADVALACRFAPASLRCSMSIPSGAS